MIRDALISPCGLYRFRLSRKMGSVLFVMNNPSTADAEIDDPSVKRCIAFARAWGYPKLTVGNTNPTRSTDPSLATVPPESALMDNDLHLMSQALRADLVIVGWGDAAHPILATRALEILRSLTPVHHLGLTKAGNPRHPLYLKGDLKPTLWT